jgi:hypothetical protein
MPTGASATRPPNLTHVLEFARAFRAAARAVAFYPASHQNVVLALDQVVATARVATAHGPVCLTILPHACMAGGVPIDHSETVVADLAGLLHRHGVGALNLDGKATHDSWRALFALLARRPDDLRAAGGIQQQWKALRQMSPAILEIDFGALLRGQVGGDFDELAGVISHYLETAGVGVSVLDDPLVALRRAIDSAPDEPQAVVAMLRELRAAAQLTWTTQPEQFDHVFRRAAAVGEYLTAGIMAGLLESRGSPEAMVGKLDVAAALIERMPDATVSQFLAKEMGPAGAEPSRLTDVFKALVPDATRRRNIVLEAQNVAFEENVLEKWSELERNLDAYSDRQFVPDQYVDELHATKDRADVARRTPDPPERVEAWVRSIDDEAVYDLDLQLLADLAHLETDPARTRAIFEILHAHVLEAADAGDWVGAVRITEEIRAAASESADGTRQLLATDILQKLAGSRVPQAALEKMADAEPSLSDTITRVLCAMGPPLAPVVARRWAVERSAPVRSRLEGLVLGWGKQGRESLRRVVGAHKELPQVRVAAIRLLRLSGATDHVPALEAALSDPDRDVRREAFRALANAPTDRDFDILARGIARADSGTQADLLEQLAGLGPERVVPILERVLLQTDPLRVAPAVYLSVIDMLKRAGSDDAASALMLVLDCNRWRAPYRAWRFKSAARSALRSMGKLAVRRKMSGPGGSRAAHGAETAPLDASAPGEERGE